MRASLLLLLLVLTACGTPQERCVRDAAAPYRVALKERQRIAQDLSRGFTYETEFERVERFTWCRGPKGSAYPCWETDMEPVTRRVPVDRAVLRARDADLARSLPTLRSDAQQGTAECRIAFPEPETAPT